MTESLTLLSDSHNFHKWHHLFISLSLFKTFTRNDLRLNHRGLKVQKFHRFLLMQQSIKTTIVCYFTTHAHCWNIFYCLITHKTIETELCKQLFIMRKFPNDSNCFRCEKPILKSASNFYFEDVMSQWTEFTPQFCTRNFNCLQILLVIYLLYWLFMLVLSKIIPTAPVDSSKTTERIKNSFFWYFGVGALAIVKCSNNQQ